MKKIIVFSLLLSMQIGMAQKNWFKTFTDSIALVKEAKMITQSFTKDIKKVNKNLKYEIKTVLHTTSYLIYFYKDTANIPLWEQVIPEQKQFFMILLEVKPKAKEFLDCFLTDFICLTN